MLYLSGVTNDRIQRRLVAAGCGILVQPGSGYVGRVDAFPAFAADNGCFTPKGTFNEAAWVRWLESVPVAGCLFAVAPDVVGDHYATVNRATPWLARIRALGLPAAFVAQNGCTPNNVLWDTFDVLFLGGSAECVPCGWVRPALAFRTTFCPHCLGKLAEWKLSAAARSMTAAAKARGKWVHMGRVNSYKRLAYAASIGVDSADGTYLAFGPDKNLPKLESWLRRLNQPDLFQEAS